MVESPLAPVMDIVNKIASDLGKGDYLSAGAPVFFAALFIAGIIGIIWCSVSLYHDTH